MGGGGETRPCEGERRGREEKEAAAMWSGCRDTDKRRADVVVVGGRRERRREWRRERRRSRERLLRGTKEETAGGA